MFKGAMTPSMVLNNVIIKVDKMKPKPQNKNMSMYELDRKEAFMNYSNK